jgi:hypothetical protein
MCGEYSIIFHGILSVPKNIVMDLKNFMLMKICVGVISNFSKPFPTATTIPDEWLLLYIVGLGGEAQKPNMLLFMSKVGNVLSAMSLLCWDSFTKRNDIEHEFCSLCHVELTCRHSGIRMYLVILECQKLCCGGPYGGHLDCKLVGP